jgi:hypothetical protein
LLIFDKSAKNYSVYVESRADKMAAQHILVITPDVARFESLRHWLYGSIAQQERFDLGFERTITAAKLHVSESNLT